ncbi:MAG: capsular biosynthesis protein [Candidatus Omnitrophica bacterium]|nr:capsular biosynthesis protein [Candidatus Omnitrophota bacterium]
MICTEKAIVIDLDQTIAQPKGKGQEYMDLKPYPKVVRKLKEYKKQGFYIIIVTARNMRTFDGNIGKINAVTLKTILAWLDKHRVPHDEVHVGRPWCGVGGFYVDDQAIRPDEFLTLSVKQIDKLLKRKAGRE